MMHLLPATTLSGENRVHHADLFTLCNALPDAIEQKCGIINVSPRATNTGDVSQHCLGVPTVANYTTRTCPVCGKEYLADPQRLKHGRQTTCSRECSYALRSSKLKADLISGVCQKCGKVFLDKPHKVQSKKFCSVSCYNTSRGVSTDLDRVCVACGKAFHARNSRRRHCSRKCFEKQHKTTMAGKGNPSYIDGRSIHTNYDAGAHWHEIRLEVYKRDKFTCQHCGVKCINKNRATPETAHRIIQCHHIDPYKRSKNNALDNLVTLCIRCHRRVHNRNGDVK